MGYYWDIINIELSFIFVHFLPLDILSHTMIQKSQLPLILATAFLDILGMSLFIPLLPSIISSFWVHASWTGYTQAFYAIGMFIWGLFFGRLSDSYGRKRMLSFTSIINLVSYIIMLISVWTLAVSDGVSVSTTETASIGFSHLMLALQGLSPMFLLFLLARFVWWLGGAGFWVIQAYIADISSPAERTKNMWLMGASFGIAFLVGPAISGILSQFVSIHIIILATFFLVFLNVLLIWFFLEEPRKHVHTEEVHLVDFHFSHTVLILLLLSFGSTMAFSAVQSMSTQFYADRFHFSATQIGYTMAMVGFISVLYQGWIVRYVRAHLDEYMMLRLAYIILIIGFIGFAYNQSPYWLFFWIAFFPIGMWSFNPSIGSLLAKSAGREIGKVMWYNTSIQSVWQIVWPILAGMLYVSAGSGLPFYASACTFVVLLLISFTLKR